MTALIITAWGILVGLGIETRRGVVLIISSILLFVLVYLFWRIGRLLDGFLQTAYRLEEFLQLSKDQRLTVTFVNYFRGVEVLQRAEDSIEKSNQDQIELSTRENETKNLITRYNAWSSKFNLFNPFRNKLVLAILLTAIIEMIIVLILVFRNELPFL